MASKKNSKYNRVLTSLAQSFSRMLHKAAAEESTAPPNYRPAEDLDVRCMTCTRYDAVSSLCTKFDQSVDPNHVCDAFERKSASETDVHAVTPNNIDRPDLLTKLSALLSQAQAPAPAPVPAGGAAAPPPPIDLGAVLGGLGGGGGMMPPPPADPYMMSGGGAGYPPPPSGAMPIDASMMGGGVPPPMAGPMPPPPPLPPEGSPPGAESGTSAKSEDEDTKKLSENLEAINAKLEKLLNLVTDLTKAISSPSKDTSFSKDREEGLSPGLPASPSSGERGNMSPQPQSGQKTAQYTPDEEDRFIDELLKLLY